MLLALLQVGYWVGRRGCRSASGQARSGALIVTCKEGLATFREARKPKILEGVELALHPLKKDEPLLSTSCLCAMRVDRTP